MTEKVTSPRKFLLPLAIVALGVAAGIGFVSTAPRTEPEETSEGRRVVQVIERAPADHAIAVTAFGTVVPAREVVMKPEVRGRVVRHHPALVPGGRVTEGEELIGIDPADYELALTAAEAVRAEAEFELEVEKGRQVVASREWRLLEKELPDDEVNRGLVLREPHLRRTEAMIRKAENDIAQARLDLARTSVKVPFNAMVLRESVEVGQLVETGSEICTLVGTDEVWVQAALPVADLRWIRLPGPGREGARARVFLDAGGADPLAWDGEVDRLLTDLEPTGRMARVLVRVPDPFGLGEAEIGTPLLIGNYVRVEIEAGVLEGALEIPRLALREGDRIWTVDADGVVDVRAAEILWPLKDSVLVRNVLEPGDRIVVAGLRVAVPGTRVEVLPADGAGERAPDA